MTAKNDVTGNPIISKPSTVLYREGWERIFNEKKNSDQTNDAIKNTKKNGETE